MLSIFIIFSTLMKLPANIDARLDSTGFVILPTGERNIYDIYEHAKKANEPLLVTSDIVFHTSHLLYDYSLRIAELNSLLPKLDTLTLGMLKATANQVQKTNDERIKPALVDNLAFFGVAATLLELDLPAGLPDEVKEKINNELKLINEHSRMKGSEIFGYFEDYTQYTPRGHYTRNYKFEQYFKAMMWYGRIGFYLKPNPTMYPEYMQIDPVKEGIKLTRRALLIVKAIEASPELMRLWEAIYEPTTFFIGKSDDFTIEEYAKFVKNVNLSKDSSIISFIAKVNKLPPPRIVSSITEDSTGLRGFRFMGQRFIPDAYVFQNLVYPKVTEYLGKGKPFSAETTVAGVMRCFPRGLDVMSVFGSACARGILTKQEDANYHNYNNQFEKLRQFFNETPLSEWKSTLYWRWLYITKLLASNSHLNCPKFMSSNEWALKELNTALGGWAELRHDAILYSKQSYTLMTTSLPRRPEFTKGWVEPYPEVYRGFADFINKLSGVTTYPEEVKNKLTKYADILNKLAEISEKELSNTPISVEEYQLIWNIGGTLRGLTMFSNEIMKEISSGTDDEMAVIADVHTDPNSKKVLEEGIGYANTIYVRVSDELTVTGGVFSYYEFKASMSDRYTDEKWQAELKNKPQKLQDWISPLIRE